MSRIRVKSVKWTRRMMNESAIKAKKAHLGAHLFNMKAMNRKAQTSRSAWKVA